MVRHIHRRYEGIKAEAAPSTLVSRDSVALAHAQEAENHAAIADCLSATTTLWLSVYGVGAAVLMGLGAWFIDRARVGEKRGGRGTPKPSSYGLSRSRGGERGRAGWAFPVGPGRQRRRRAAPRRTAQSHSARQSARGPSRRPPRHGRRDGAVRNGCDRALAGAGHRLVTRSSSGAGTWPGPRLSTRRRP